LALPIAALYAGERNRIPAMKRNDLYLKGLGIEIRAVGPLAIAAAVAVITLLSLLATHGNFF
jgi:hypothetical protein